MKKLIKVNAARHSIRILCALGIALPLTYYVSATKQGWLPFATIIVMFTATGSALYQGLLRFFLITVIVVIGSLIFSPTYLLYMRMYDVVLGALVGILANIVILPDRVDFECRTAFIPILQSYVSYFSALVALLLQRDLLGAEREKINVEKKLQQLPEWVYEVGFDVTLQKGYRYFFMKVGQIGEVLFAMHHLARYPFSDELLNTIREPLLQCVIRVEQFIVALIRVLELKKLTEGIVDFGAELMEIEEKFKVIVPPALEVAEVAKDYVYLTEFIYDLRDLRSSLLRLTEALR